MFLNCRCSTSAGQSTLRVPVFQGVGIVLTQPEQVFQRLMDVGDNRLEWDTTFDRCLVPERVDKFTDIVELAQKEKVLFRRINSDDCNLFRRTAFLVTIMV